MNSNIQYIRAFSIVSVFLFHLFPDIFVYGYLGVDIFFVLSGFLISRQLYKVDNSLTAIRNYILKRINRVYFLLLITVISSCIVSFLFSMPLDLIDQFNSSIFSMLFISNYLFFTEASYFDASSETKLLLHTWSLSAEIQFYLLSALLSLLFKKHKLIFVYIAVLIVSLVSQIIFLEKQPEAVFYLSPFRCWEFYAGGIVGVSVLMNSEKARVWYSALVYLLMVSLCVLFLWKSEVQYLVIALSVTALKFVEEGDFFKKNNVLRVLFRVVGDRSFAIYMVHWPVICTFRSEGDFELDYLTIFFIVIITLLLAELMFRYIEPLRRYSAKPIVYQALFYSISVVSCTLSYQVVKKAEGLPERSHIASKNQLNYVADKRTLQLKSWRFLDIETGLVKDDGGITRLKKPHILLIGNSHSKDAYNILRFSDIFPHINLRRYPLQLRHLVNDGHEFWKSVEFLNSESVILSSRYSIADLEAIRLIVDKIKASGKRVIVATNVVEFPEYGAKSLADVLIRKRLRAGSKFDALLIADVNRYHWNLFTHSRDSNEVGGWQWKNTQLVNKLAGLEIIWWDRASEICFSDQCTILLPDGGKTIYDYGHLTLEGAASVAKIHGHSLGRIFK